MKIELHPSLNDFDPLSDAERSALKKSIKKHGCKHPVLLWKSAGRHWLMDGRHRYELCNELGMTFDVKIVEGTEDEAKAIAVSLNDDRRHRTPEQRAERIARVAAARREGQSLRAIAAEEGVSESQIRRDLSTAPGGAVEPEGGKVKGKDGKTRPAKKKSKPPEDAGDSWEGESKTPRVQPMDSIGNPIPKNLRDVFAGSTESIEQSIKLLQEVRRTVKSLQKWNPYMRPGEMETKLDELIEDFKNGRPFSVCQACEGKGCKACRTEGWLPEWRHKEVA